MGRFVTVSGVSGVGLVILGIAVPLILPEQLPEDIRRVFAAEGTAPVLAAIGRGDKHLLVAIEKAP